MENLIYFPVNVKTTSQSSSVSKHMHSIPVQQHQMPFAVIHIEFVQFLKEVPTFMPRIFRV